MAEALRPESRGTRRYVVIVREIATDELHRQVWTEVQADKRDYVTICERKDVERLVFSAESANMPSIAELAKLMEAGNG